MSTQSQQLSSLGYSEANASHLFRSEEGIISQDDSKHAFWGLCNYPTTVQISGRAVREIDTLLNKHGHHSMVKVYANLQSGKEIPIFSITTNFFNRVLANQETNKDAMSYEVRAFENTFTSERSLIDAEIDNREIVRSFGAKYVHGPLVQYGIVAKTHEFTNKFFNTDKPSEKIVLQIGVKEHDDWDLAIHQRKGVS